MVKRKKTDDTRTTLPGEEVLTRAYRDASRDSPPPALDAKIVAHAREALAAPRAQRRFAKRWAVPVSAAALVVLSLGVVLQLSQRDVIEFDESVPTLADAPTQRAAVPESAGPPAESRVEQKSAASEFARDAASPTAAAAPERHVPSAPAAEREQAARSDAPAARSKLYAERAGSRGTASVAQNIQVSDKAHVMSVKVSGSPGAYEFSVGIRSPDTGCQQYADWWEVIGADGALLYRLVLQHSHVDQQPFARAGGPVPIQPDTVVWIRAHMNNTGYGGAALKGSVAKGFSQVPLAPEFAAALTKQQPLPQSCER